MTLSRIRKGLNTKHILQVPWITILIIIVISRHYGASADLGMPSLSFGKTAPQAQDGNGERPAAREAAAS